MTNLQQVTQDRGRSVTITREEVKVNRAVEEMKVISRLLDQLLRDGLGDDVDCELFCAQDFLEAAIRRAR